MRYLFALLVLILGLGAVVVTTDNTGGAGARVMTAFAGAQGNAQPAETVIQVDRDDDPATIFDCTSADNDCTLRSAISKANSDGTSTTITFADHFMIQLSDVLPSISEDGTIIRTGMNQEVHIAGNNLPGSILHITGANVMIKGLRLYGAGEGYANISIGGKAHDVVIADNIIGDDDAPTGRCRQEYQSYAGIYVNAVPDQPSSVPAYIHGNIIECHTGNPGLGILVVTDNVVIGKDNQGRAEKAQRNIIRWNRGFGIRLSDNGGNVLCNNTIHFNQAGGLSVANFNNDILENDIQVTGYSWLASTQ